MPDIQEDNIKILYEYFMVSRTNKAILVQENRTKFCAFCNSDLDIEEGVTIYNKNWYHDKCWDYFEEKNGDVLND